MIDHATIGVRDLDRSRRFYEAALAPLGVTVHLEREGMVGFGDSRPFFFLAAREPTAGVRLAFAAADRAACDAFHAAALEAGGRDNGAPGPRPQYHRVLRRLRARPRWLDANVDQSDLSAQVRPDLDLMGCHHPRCLVMC